MIAKLDDYLIGAVLGLRFRANFSLEDQFGRIADEILYGDGTSFGPDLFPTVQSRVGGKRLYNEETEDKLTIDNSNFILEIGTSEKRDSAGVDGLIQAFNTEIVRGTMKTFGVREFLRIGYIRRYLFTISDLAKTFVSRTIGETLEGVEDINLSFSKKLPAEKAYVKRDVEDYYNVIFNIIKHADREEIYMSVDYQHIFVPPLPTVAEIEYDKFIARAKDFNNKKYLPWLNNNYIEVR